MFRARDFKVREKTQDLAVINQIKDRGLNP